MRTRGISILAVFALFLVSNALSIQTVTIGWDAGPEPDIAGYHLFMGTRSHDYPDEIDVTMGTSTSVTLDEGETYYFAVSAYNTLGNESPPSDEISYTVPGTPTPGPIPPTTPLDMAFVLTLEASSDSDVWTPLAIIPIGTAHSLEFFRTKMTVVAAASPNPSPTEQSFELAVEASDDLQIWTPFIVMPLKTTQSTQFLRTLMALADP